MRTHNASGLGLVSMLLSLAIVAVLLWWLLRRTGNEVTQAKMARLATDQALVQTDAQGVARAIEDFQMLYGELPRLEPNPCPDSCILQGSRTWAPVVLSPGVEVRVEPVVCNGAPSVKVTARKGTATASRTACGS